jgi:hypothetical protein
MSIHIRGSDAAIRVTSRIPCPHSRTAASSAFSNRAATIVATVTGGAAFAALDDFTLATPSLEDVYLTLGGNAQGLVKA